MGSNGRLEMSGNLWKVIRCHYAGEIAIEAPFKNRHDVRIYVNGDFSSDRQKLIYANRICKQLNETATKDIGDK